MWIVSGFGRCKHVLIYGPPGAGKLTVARSLADRYGVRVLDNHLTVDAALRLFSFGTPEFARLVERLRVALIEAAAEEGLDVVSTFVYAHGVDDDHVARLISAAEGAGAEVVLVQLLPATDELERRLTSASRAGTTKITDLAVLRRIMDERDLSTPFHTDDLTFDNTALAPDDVADEIASRVGLPRRDRRNHPGDDEQRAPASSPDIR